MINDNLNDIKAKITQLLRDAGVRDISYGDIYKSTPVYPAINIYLEERNQADNQVFGRGIIYWDLSYTIHCLFKGSEGQQTFDNTIKFVDKIYDILQSEQDDEKLLDDNCIDINCGSVKYGRTNVTMLNQQVIEVNGGTIAVIIRIIEER